MVGPVQRGASTSTLEHAVIDAVGAHGGLAPGEVLTHFDLVAETRMVDDEGVERTLRLHWSMPGSSGHMSYGVLAAQAEKVLRRIS